MFFRPKLFQTEGSKKLFVCTGVNEFAMRFGGYGYRWQPVKRLIWKIYVNDGDMFLDTPRAFTKVENVTDGFSWRKSLWYVQVYLKLWFYLKFHYLEDFEAALIRANCRVVNLQGGKAYHFPRGGKVIIEGDVVEIIPADAGLKDRPA